MESSQCRERLKALGGVVVIPTYDNGGTIAKVVTETLQYCEDVIVVNDGSIDDTNEKLKPLSDKIRILTHPMNWGKGVALRNGFDLAKELEFKYVITLDADGQHFPSDIPAFVESIENNEGALIVGAKKNQAEGVQNKKSFADRFSNFWYKLETGVKLEDTQSGFRAYPIDRMNLNGRLVTSGYEFEHETLVFAAWDGVKVMNIPIRVYYPPESERVSHFRPIRDFTRIFLLNTALVLYCFFWKWPADFFRSLTKERIKLFIYKHIVHSPDSNMKIGLSAGFGVMMGILPLWGYQMILAFSLSHLLKLNKYISLLTSNISIPPMIPLIIYASCWLGMKLIGPSSSLTLDQISRENLGTILLQYIVGAVVLAILAGIIVWLLTWMILNLSGRKADRDITKE